MNGGVRGGWGSRRGGSPGNGSSRGGSSGVGGSSIDGLGSAACVMQRERCKRWSVFSCANEMPTVLAAAGIAAKHEHVAHPGPTMRQRCQR